MPPKEPKKTKAELKAEAAAEAQRLAEIAEAERLERERIAAEQYAAAQAARKAALQECMEELDQQQDAEDADKWQRDNERQRQLSKETEKAEWQAFLNPSHLPSVEDEVFKRELVIGAKF